jgi:DUF1680 family protein
LQRSAADRLAFGGLLGQALEAVTASWLLPAPAANPAILEMFADRDVPPYRSLMPWAGEFAGKYLTASVQVLRARPDEGLRRHLAGFTAQLVSLQAEDGYLGPWPADSRLTGLAPNTEGATWDAWGHYHILVGLLHWHEESGDPAALASAVRIGDLLCQRFLRTTGPRMVDMGMTEMNLAPAHGLALLYARSGDQRHLDLALQLVEEEFAAAGPQGLLAGDYLRQGLAGTPFYATPKPRWESLHPLMSLAELFYLTGRVEFHSAFASLWTSMRDFDRHNNGGFTAGEQATGNPYHPGAIETCCTIAWMALSVEMLKLGGSPLAADELELSTYNAVLGMHSRSGRWATYNTPSDGARFASAHQIVFQARSGGPELNCCSVNSPRGLGLLSEWAWMHGPSGLYLNAYAPGSLETALPDGMRLKIQQETAYPLDGQVTLTLQPEQPVEFSLFLRIPAWSRHTAVRVNGDLRPEPPPGAYLELRRLWRAGDRIELVLDFSLRAWQGERECVGLTSLYRGPLLLAYDTRYNRELQSGAEPSVFGADPWQTQANCLAAPEIAAGSVQSQPLAWQGWLPPCLLLEARSSSGQVVRLCDFASAGQTGTAYRSWLPVRGI